MSSEADGFAVGDGDELIGDDDDADLAELLGDFFVTESCEDDDPPLQALRPIVVASAVAAMTVRDEVMASP